ncbi:MAG: DUF4406 domain-containing protein [Acidobacteriota bacterium]|nr:DUF4406 domain-containing protein [Acidobacteriota bacterium]
MDEPTRVYVAGPFTKPSPIINTRRAIDAAEQLRRAGYSPFVPHLFFAWEMVHPDVGYEGWMALDFEWLAACDAIVRMPGESPGADREVAFARERGIAVFAYSDEAGIVTDTDTAYVEAAIEWLRASPPKKRFAEHPLDRIVREMPGWQAHNFPGRPAYWPLLGMVEELGELAHAFLKAEQKIRGTPEEHRAMKIDAVIDLFVFGIDFCGAEKIDLRAALTEVWGRVRTRDWRKFPRYGIAHGHARAKLLAKREALDREIASIGDYSGYDAARDEPAKIAPPDQLISAPNDGFVPPDRKVPRR